MLLGIIIRSKHRKHPSVSQRLASQSGILAAAAATGPPPPLAVLPSSSETGIKRHNSASEEILGGVKRTRFQLEIGVGDQTPPILGQTPPSFGEQEEKEKSADNSPYEPGCLDPVKEGEERLMKKIQMSFYGEHQPMESTSEKTPRDTASMAVTNTSDTEAAGGSQDPIPQPTSSSFQSLLSQLSKEKLEELASVVSSISGQPGSAGAPAGTSVSATHSQSPLKAPPATVNYSSNPEPTNAIPATSDVGGPQPHGQLGVDYSPASGQAVGAQIQVAPLQLPAGSYGEGQWNQEPVQQPPQPQQTQFYQTLQYPADQQHPTAAAAITAGSGGSGTPDQFQQHHQAYPIQGEAPYANYSLPVQNQALIDTQHQDGRGKTTAVVGHYAASQEHQQYSGDQYAAHGDSSHHPTPPQQGHAHHSHQGHAQQPQPTQGPAHQSHPPQHQWDQHQSYRQDYGNHRRSHYYEGHGGSGGVGAGYREGYGEGRHPSSHHHSKAGGWDHGREHGGHQRHQFHGRGGHDRYHDHWQRGDHERDRHWR